MVARVFVTVLWVLLLYRIPFIKKGFEDLGIDTYVGKQYFTTQNDCATI